MNREQTSLKYANDYDKNGNKTCNILRKEKSLKEENKKKR